MTDDFFSGWKRPDVCGGIETLAVYTVHNLHNLQVGKDLMFAVGLRRPPTSSMSRRDKSSWKRPDVCGGIETFNFPYPLNVILRPVGKDLMFAVGLRRIGWLFWLGGTESVWLEKT